MVGNEIIHSTDRHRADPAGCDEHLIGLSHIVHCEQPLLERDREACTELENNLACYPFKNIAFRCRPDHTFADNEKIGDRVFRHIAIRIEHQGK